MNFMIAYIIYIYYVLTHVGENDIDRVKNLTIKKKKQIDTYNVDMFKNKIIEKKFIIISNHVIIILIISEIYYFQKY